MMISRKVVLALALAAGPVLAQQPGRELSAAVTNSAVLRDDSKLLAPLIEETKVSQDVIAGKKLELSGPLVRPFKARKIREVPRRLLHLINPIAPLERKEEFESTRGLSVRAWTSVVGWNAGGSAFPDALTHESSMGLISLTKTSKE
jgi:hypothetical protein